MGGPVDNFVVRLVLAMTVIAWGSVLLHDVLTEDPPAESVAPASATERGDALPGASELVPPTNETPDERDGLASGALLIQRA